MNISEAKQRLIQCQRTHKNCGSQVTPTLPQRVVDVMAPKVAGKLSLDLVLHVSSGAERGEYTALSYCWGTQVQTKLTRKKYKSMIAGFSSGILAQSIKDAIEVTRKLGIRYLWVDALCIIQDSSEDKAKEIDGMGQIFSDATLTIAAANSSSAHAGFLSSKNTLIGCSLPFILPNGEDGKVIAVPCFSYKHPEGYSPLSSRGWAFQEYVLSARVLYFGAGDVSWKCRATLLEPLFSTPFLPPAGDEEIYSDLSRALWEEKSRREWKSSEKHHIWIEIVENYSDRILSLTEDRLPALAGIAERLNHIWRDEYLAGIWKSCLPKQLCWYRQRPDQLPLHPYQGPSWSWISIEGRVFFERDDTSIEVEILDCDVQLESSEARYGRVKSGALTLAASVLEPLPVESRHRFKFDHGYDYIEHTNACSFGSNFPYSLVKIGTRKYSRYWDDIVALLVRQLGEGKYRRVGFLVNGTSPISDRGVWDRVERKVITIV